MAHILQTAHRIRRLKAGEQFDVTGLFPLNIASGNWCCDGEPITFVADEQGETVAMCSVAVIDSEVVYLAELWVSPKYRSRGILKHMLNRVMQQLKALGYRELVIRIMNGERSIEQMFASLGFKVYITEAERKKKYQRLRNVLNPT